MRYAIVSDIHANRFAWDAVVTDLTAFGVDSILCLGDVVGYGPEPARVLDSVREHCDHFVLGNHDAVVAGRLDSQLFSAAARRVIDWTCAQMKDNAADFFRSVPMAMNVGDLHCCHAEAAVPERFTYINSAPVAKESLLSADAPLILVGHTHVPRSFAMDPVTRTMFDLPAGDFTREAPFRYLVNCGSVGDPRDEDPRASYCIYDAQSHQMFFRRVPFDYQAYLEAAARVQLPVTPYFLSLVGFDLPNQPEPESRILAEMVPVEPGQASHGRVVKFIIPDCRPPLKLATGEAARVKIAGPQALRNPATGIRPGLRSGPKSTAGSPTAKWVLAVTAAVLLTGIGLLLLPGRNAVPRTTGQAGPARPPSAGPGNAPFRDDFNGPGLGSGWEEEDRPRDEALDLEAHPGWLQMKTEKHQDSSANTRGGSPILIYSRLPPRDFAIETHLDHGPGVPRNTLAGLVIRDLRDDQNQRPFRLCFALGDFGEGTWIWLQQGHKQLRGPERVDFSGCYLRIERLPDQKLWKCFWKQRAADPWTLHYAAHDSELGSPDGPQVRVGLISKAWSDQRAAPEFDYFSLHSEDD
ncbi:MAG: metallophosphoesterase family protein [Akkermansiaceae bacterium]|nr:metallophosphoesterase family protein [Akkermansiaceae bacterium]